MRFDCINNLEGTNITSIFFSQTKLLTHGVKQLRHFFRLVVPVPVVSYSRAGQCETAPFVFFKQQPFSDSICYSILLEVFVDC